MIQTTPMPQKLKRVVIKQEIVEITGKFQSALILNQLIYWTERTRDFDKFLEEENKRNLFGGLEPINVPLFHGWIYKSASELSEELMLGVSDQTIGRYIKELEDLGFIHERSNPIHKWDRTKQYRVDFQAVCNALEQKGRTLDGYHFPKNTVPDSKPENQKSNFETLNFQNGKAIPETTAKTTTETTTAVAAFPENEKTQKPGPIPDKPENPLEQIADLIPIPLTPSLAAVIENAAAQHGTGYVINSILYANNNVKDKNKYRFYLEKALENGWGEGYEPPPPPPKQAPKPVSINDLNTAGQIFMSKGKPLFDKFCKARGIGPDDIARIMNYCSMNADQYKEENGRKHVA
jgi:hypothetical protein